MNRKTVYWKNRVLRTVILGTSDSRSPLKLLRGYQFLLQNIFDMVVESWISHIDIDARGFMALGAVQFPPSRDIQIHMMPFVIGDRSSLPDIYEQYWPMIRGCNVGIEERGKVGYLSINEGLTKKGTSPMRDGLYTESSGRTKTKMGNGQVRTREEYGWSYGSVFYSSRKGGIYMASNMPVPFVVWNVCITNPEHVVGSQGEVEHLRDYIGLGTRTHKNKLYWITDKTPYEFLPRNRIQVGQYFRLVTSEVSVWYEEHSTKNPLGILPDCFIVKSDKVDNGDIDMAG